LSDAHQGRLTSELLAKLDGADIDAGLVLLNEHGLATPETAAALAEMALESAEAAPNEASYWLSVAAALDGKSGGNSAIQAKIYYAQARIHLQQGELQMAERALRQAQSHWLLAADEASLTRSYLGLTQILALQGRFEEATQAIRKAIERLPAGTIQLAWAYQNLANLLGRQGKYEAALETYDQARAILAAQLEAASERPPDPADPDPAEMLAKEIATVDLNRANALVALDRPHEAELSYRSALAYFDQYNDQLNRGRLETNLGALFLRTGRYAAAMDYFSRAEVDLLGELSLAGPVDPAQLRQADILLLDQANAYLALNLLREAVTALERCQTLFRTANQPYELAQSLYLLGLLYLRDENPAAAACLHEAHSIFTDLGNLAWRNRLELALAQLDLQTSKPGDAAERLDHLLLSFSDALHPSAQQAERAPTMWDTTTLVEAQLLRLQLFLNEGETASARTLAHLIAYTLNRAVALPHLRLRLEYALGAIALVEDDRESAHEHLYKALSLLEEQRMSLPIEEFRTAYLADKFHIYDSLVLSLLDQAESTPQRAAEAFAVVERARSRTLLERLQTTLVEDQEPDDPADELPQQAQLYGKLHWLYNQLLSEGAQGPQLAQDLESYESALERLSWRSTQARQGADELLMAQAQPLSLEEFQRRLGPDQQALLYYTVGPAQQPDRQWSEGEVLAFLVDRTEVKVIRRLCKPEQLAQAAEELRFQLGRAELGSNYLARHGARLNRAVQAALYELYRLLLAPVDADLHAPRLLFIPHGLLHRLPLHALWDGSRYILERFICCYAPSASIAIHATSNSSPKQYHSLAGVALTDPAIPQARREVELAARCFPQSWLYLDGNADRQGLIQAAAQADILHIATHGLFRPDNPFFSALKLADGWIDVRSIYRLPLSARLVILSACESGSGKIRGGDEVIGLARGFLGAGAQELIVSLWNVHDETSVDIMVDLYEFLIHNGDTAAALRAAQIAAIQKGLHPYFWASFLTVGT
jgi:CHAT domain-containing protein/tetratricopeptide (TPR) repeat protein